MNSVFGAGVKFYPYRAATKRTNQVPKKCWQYMKYCEINIRNTVVMTFLYKEILKLICLIKFFFKSACVRYVFKESHSVISMTWIAKLSCLYLWLGKQNHGALYGITFPLLAFHKNVEVEVQARAQAVPVSLERRVARATQGGPGGASQQHVVAWPHAFVAAPSWP